MTIASQWGPKNPSGPLLHAETSPAKWPSLMIVFLCSLSVIAPPIVLTVANSALVISAVLVLIASNQRIDPRLWHLVLPFVLILVIGLSSGAGADQYTYFKDAWYVSNPLLVMLAGYVLFKAHPQVDSGLRAFVLAGALTGLWQARAYMFDPGMIMLSAVAIRERIGTGDYPPVLAVVIMLLLLGAWRRDLKMPLWACVTLMGVAALAVVGVFSRTAVMVAMVAFAARVGCFARNEWLRLGLPVLTVVLTLFLLESLFGTRSGQDLNSFVGKLVNSLREVAIRDTSSLVEINTNFRGYESAQALKQVLAGSPREIFFGQGFGALVDLGLFIPLGGFEGGMPLRVRLIPVLHNGYMYLLVKGGIVSLMLYIYVLAYLYCVGRRWAALDADDDRRNLSRLMQAVVVSLAATTYVIGGVFNKNDMFAFLLCTGYLLAFMNHRHHAPSN